MPNRTTPAQPVGRFAPSPTGRMHLGNIFTALMSWLSVKSRGGRWILRIEDLDPQRSRPEHARLVEEDLLWLGLQWDEGGLDDAGPNGPYSQSRRSDLYAHFFGLLQGTGFTYPCRCSRADLMASNAPHLSDGRVVYSGRCRPPVLPATIAAEPADAPGRRPAATRLYVPDFEISFTDIVAGEQCFNLSRDCGDFIIRRSDGAWAYQLAVVVDDALMGVTEVLRGNDLLISAAQQTYLYSLLRFAPPAFAHIPLICNTAGQRLSKRDESMSMAELRKRFTPKQLIGQLAHIARLTPTPDPVDLADLLPVFTLAPLASAPAMLSVNM